MKAKISVVLLIILIFSPSFSLAPLSRSTPETYEIPRFWDWWSDYCYHQQEKSYYCGPASVQMVLDYLGYGQPGYEPLPSQSELANELHTEKYNTTYLAYMKQPFFARSLTNLFEGRLANSFDGALNKLKTNVSQDYPVIILMWFDVRKEDGHYVVVIGYNSSGVFINDPAYGEALGREVGHGKYLQNRMLDELWGYSVYWGMIVRYHSKVIITWKIVQFGIVSFAAIVAIVIFALRKRNRPENRP